MLIVCYYYLLTLFSINKVRNSSVNIQSRRQTEEKGDKSDFMASNHLWSDWFWISVIFSSLETTGQSISLNWRVLFKKLPKKLISAWVLAYCSSRQNFKHNSSSINVVLYDTRSGLVSIGPVLRLVLYNSKLHNVASGFV